MTNYKRVWLSVDRTPLGHQLSIGCKDTEGVGHGYRLAGPKYNGQSRPVLEHDLTAEDVVEIRRYLAIWEGIAEDTANGRGAQAGGGV